MIFFFGFADARQTCPDPARHALFQRNIAYNIIFLGILLDRTQHRGRSAGIDHIRFQRLFPDRIHHISFCADASVFCGNINLAVLLKLLFQKCLRIPITDNNLLFLTFHLLCKFQNRRNADSSSHQEYPLSVCQFIRKSVSERSDDRKHISRFHLGKLLSSGVLPGHTVNNTEHSLFFIDLANADRTRKQFTSVICIHGDKLSRLRRLRCLTANPHTENSICKLFLQYDNSLFSLSFHLHSSPACFISAPMHREYQQPSLLLLLWKHHRSSLLRISHRLPACMPQ